MQFDYNYLCHGLGHLTGLETRVYKNEVLIEHYSSYSFYPDIAGLIRQEINTRQENVFYIETEALLVFGVVKSVKDQIVLIIGPASQIRPRKQETVDILYRLGEPYSRLSELQAYFSNVVPYPFENFLEILCFVNYSLNGEKLSVSHLIRKNGALRTVTSGEWAEKEEEEQSELHNTFQAEKLMLSYVTTGNVEAVQAFFTKPPSGRSGYMAHNELRQRKNVFVCAATLISRAAITGGMPSDTAFALSDRYIQKVELLNNGGEISVLNMEMLLDYTKRVEALRCNTGNSRLARNIMRYILKNIGKKITINDMAEALNMNRSYLCEYFKAETGSTIGEFITVTKVEEAKRMLLLSDLSIAHISSYLSFSSQSYFQTVFKKIEGCTPKEYRRKSQAEQVMVCGQAMSF